jgi:hypothetical protein
MEEVKTVVADPKPDPKPAEQSPEVKAALDAANKAGEAVKQMSEQMRQMQEKLDAATVGQKPPAKKDGQVDLATLMYTDPEEFIRVSREQMREELRAEQSTTRQQEQFWEEFYKENKDLKEYSDYVEYTFQRELPGYIKKNNTVGDSIKQLGETVKAAVLKMKGGKNEAGGNKKTPVEGGSERNQSLENTSDVDESESTPPPSTESILNERKAARRKAAQPGRR